MPASESKVPASLIELHGLTPKMLPDWLAGPPDCGRPPRTSSTGRAAAEIRLRALGPARKLERARPLRRAGRTTRADRPAAPRRPHNSRRPAGCAAQARPHLADGPARLRLAPAQGVPPARGSFT